MFRWNSSWKMSYAHILRIVRVFFKITICNKLKIKNLRKITQKQVEWRSWITSIVYQCSRNNSWTTLGEILIRLVALFGGFAEELVLCLGFVPESVGDGEGWKGHYCESDPVEEVRRELLVVLGQANDCSLTGLRAYGILQLKWGESSIKVTEKN